MTTTSRTLTTILATAGLAAATPAHAAEQKISPDYITHLALAITKADCAKRQYFHHRAVYVKTHHCARTVARGFWHPPLRANTGYALAFFELHAEKRWAGLRDIRCDTMMWFRRNRDGRTRRLAGPKWRCKDFDHRLSPVSVPAGLRQV